MNSKIIKVERILVQVVPRFYEMMMIGEPPNHRWLGLRGSSSQGNTVQRDDLRLPQLRGDWSPRRSSTIILSSVHIKLIKHPMSMMWKFPTSTMVSFRLCFFLNRERDLKKKHAFPFRMRHTVPGGSRCKESTKISQIFRTILSINIINLITIRNHVWSNHRLYCLITPIYNCV